MRWLRLLWLALWAVFSLPWTSFTSTPHWDRVQPPRVNASSRIRPDHLLNVLFYVPGAPLGSTLGWTLPACVIAGSVLSVTAEAVQLFSVDRDPDGNDVIANIAGTSMGALVVLFYRRRSGSDRRR